MNQQNQRRSNTPAIVMFLVAGALILAVGRYASRSGAARTDLTPPLHIVAPTDGSSVDNPVALRFSTPAPLRLGRDGWTAGDLHLHVMVDDVELMPAAADIRQDGDAFTWTLPHIEAGTRRIHLTWAGRHHGNLATPTDTIVVHVR